MIAKKNVLILLAVGVVIAVITPIFFVVKEWRRDAEVIPARVGVIFPTTSLAEGAEMHNAATLAVEEWNTRGGIDGRPVELLAQDGGCDRGRARMAAEHIIVKHRSPYIVGGFCGEEVQGISEVVENGGILVSPSVQVSSVVAKDDGVFVFASSFGTDATILAEYLVDQNEKKSVALAFERSGASQVFADIFEKKFVALGGSIGAKKIFSMRSIAAETVATDMTSGENDVFVLLAETPAYATGIIDAIRKARPQAEIYVPEQTLVSALDRPQFEGVRAIRVQSATSSDAERDFIKKYEERYGMSPRFVTLAAVAYDATEIVLEAVDHEGYNHPDAVRQRIASTKRRKGATGTITFDGAGNRVQSYEIVEWRGGKVESVQIIK